MIEDKHYYTLNGSAGFLDSSKRNQRFIQENNSINALDTFRENTSKIENLKFTKIKQKENNESPEDDFLVEEMKSDGKVESSKLSSRAESPKWRNSMKKSIILHDSSQKDKSDFLNNSQYSFSLRRKNSQQEDNIGKSSLRFYPNIDNLDVCSSRQNSKKEFSNRNMNKCDSLEKEVSNLENKIDTYMLTSKESKIENFENSEKINSDVPNTPDTAHTAQEENQNKFRYEDVNVANVIKRVMEKNKKEAAVRQRDFFSNYPQNYMNLNMNRTGGKFFINPSNNQGSSHQNFRPQTDNKEKTMNYLEITIQDVPFWRKHEEIWNSVLSPGYNVCSDIEKYILPPNEFDILVSSYSKINNIYREKIIIDDKILNAKEEIQKWKNAYKRAVLRWHPDKLFAFLDNLKLKDDCKKNTLKKKSSIIMHNMNKLLQSILEILKKIIAKKERDLPGTKV